MARNGFPSVAKWGLAAAALAGMAVFNRKKAREAEAETPPIGNFVEIDGVRLHYVEHGDGPPLIMLHGMGALVQDFLGSGLIDCAAEHYRVIAFDRPGYGYSDRPTGKSWTPEAQATLIGAALRKLGIERPIILGHSWGTLVALALALDQVEIAGLVLVAGPYFPIARPEPLLLALPALPGIGPTLANTVSPLLVRAAGPATLRRIFAPNPVPPEFTARFPRELALRPGHIRATAGDAGLLQLAELRMAKRYAELTMPVAIVGGDSDRLVDYGQAERMHTAIPQSSLRRAEGVGHMVHWIMPELVMAAVDDVAGRMAQTD